MSNSPATSAASSDPAILHQEDDVQVGAIVLWGIIATVITVASVFGLHALHNWYKEQLMPERLYGVQNVQADEVIASQKAKLVAPPAWVDQEQGRVSIPIDRAFKLTLDEYESK